jgi:hypothetical protein
LPSATDKPTVPASISLLANVEAPVLVINPSPSAFNVDIAPVKPITIFDCALLIRSRIVS